MCRFLCGALAVLTATVALAGASAQEQEDCEGKVDEAPAFISASSVITVIGARCTGTFAETVTNNGSVTLIGQDTVGLNAVGPRPSIINNGQVLASGLEAVAIGAFGGAATITNNGTATVNQAFSSGLYVVDTSEGDAVNVTNNGLVEAFGQGSFGIDIDAPASGPIRVTNSGTVTQSGGSAAAIGVGGNNTRVINQGTVSSTGSFVAAIGVVGDDSFVENTADISTSGTDTIGLGAIGQNGMVVNNGSVSMSGSFGTGLFGAGQTVQLFNAVDGRITGTGQGMAGLSFGANTFQTPIGVDFSPSELATQNVNISNRGRISLSGTETSGIFGNAQGVQVANEGVIGVTGFGSRGLDMAGQGWIVTNGTETMPAEISASGTQAIGAYFLGRNVAVRNEVGSTISASGINSIGTFLGIEPGSSSLSLLSNAGMIEGELYGAYGVGGNANLINDQTGTIEATGDQSIGALFVDAAQGGRFDVRNEGTIRGVRNGVTFVANGASIINGVSGEANSSVLIENTGGIDVQGAAISGNGNDARLENYATLRGGRRGVVFGGDDVTINNQGLIEATSSSGFGAGELFVPNGVQIFGNGLDLENAGIIRTESGEGAGVFIQGQDALITNASGATINPGIVLESTATGGDIALTLINSGSIINEGRDLIIPEFEGSVGVAGTGFLDLSGTDGHLVVQNEAGGLISGDDHAFLTENLSVSVVNNGRILQTGDTDSPVFQAVGGFSRYSIINNAGTDGNGIISSSGGGVLAANGGPLGIADSSFELINRGTMSLGQAAGASDAGRIFIANASTFREASFLNEGAIEIGGREASGALLFVTESGILQNEGTLTVEAGMAGSAMSAAFFEAPVPEATAILENSGQISLTTTNRSNAAALDLFVDAPTTRFADASPPVAACVGGPGRGASLNNCGQIALQGDDLRGIQVTGAANFDVQNDGNIFGTGDGQVGITIDSAGANPFGGAGALARTVFQLGEVSLNGEGVVGVQVEAPDALVLNGVGAIDLENANVFVSLEAFVEQVATGSALNEGFKFGVGDINVAGINSTGMALSGDGILGGNSLLQPDDGASQNQRASRITATGAGSIGLSLSGENATFVNYGIISGEGLAVRGGAFGETLINGNTIMGDVDMGGGNDVFELRLPGTPVLGLVEGGAGFDALSLNVAELTLSEISSLPFSGFEEVVIRGGGAIQLTDDWSIPTEINQFGLNVVEGIAVLNNAFTYDLGAKIGQDGALVGVGSISGPVLVDGGIIEPGQSPGLLTFESDLTLTNKAVIRFEINGTETSMYDRIVVLGDLLADDDVIFEFDFGIDFTSEEPMTFDILEVVGNMDIGALVLRLSEGSQRVTLAQVLGPNGMFAIVASVAPIPLPPASILMLFGFLALASRRFRNR